MDTARNRTQHNCAQLELQPKGHLNVLEALTWYQDERYRLFLINEPARNNV
jgi:hypothetical protein